MADVTFDQGYFDAMYRANPDPWEFRSSQYEQSKYAATLAALPGPRYAHALELGCSIGELTCQLATRVDRLTAVDTSAVALTLARTACQSFPHVEFVQAHLPGGNWARHADLVLLSEILYYLDEASVRLVARQLRDAAPDADMVLVHWTGETNYPMTGDDATAAFLDELSPTRVESFRAPAYRLDVIRGSTPA